MDSPVNTAHPDFIRARREAREMTHDAWQHVRCGGKWDAIRFKEARENLSARFAENTVPAHIGRNRRSCEQVIPLWIRLGGRVAIFISAVNRSHRPPKIVSILCLPTNGR